MGGLKPYVVVQSLSHVWVFATLWTAAYQPSLSFTISGVGSNSVQAPLSVAFSRWKYRSGLPFPPSGDLPDPGIELESPASPALAGFFTTEPPGKPSNLVAKIESLINVWWESWLNDRHTVSAYWMWSKDVICMKYINLKIIIWGGGYHLHFTMDKETEIKDWWTVCLRSPVKWCGCDPHGGLPHRVFRALRHTASADDKTFL